MRSKTRVGHFLQALAVGALLASPSLAQVEEQFDQREYYIDGVQVDCGDVVTIVRRDETELIYAKDYSTIVIHGTVFDTLPPGLRLFAYFQTCSMIFYDDATPADASAIRRGMANQWLSVADIETMCQTNTLLEAGWSVAPDGPRCDAIIEIVRAALN